MQTEEQIDAWYEKKKQALFDKYYGGIVDRKKRLEDKSFNEASAKLRLEYEKKFDAFRKSAEKNNRLKKKMQPALNLIAKLQDIWHKLVELYK